MFSDGIYFTGSIEKTGNGMVRNSVAYIAGYKN